MGSSPVSSTPSPNAKVIIYYSGHGATNRAQSETYLLPVDAEPYREERSGYKLSTLYANLAGLKAKSVLVLLETEYGRDHGAYVLPPNLPEMTSQRAATRAVSGGHGACRRRPRPAHAGRHDLRYRPVHPLCDRGARRRRRSRSRRAMATARSTARRSMPLRPPWSPLGAQDLRAAAAAGLFRRRAPVLTRRVKPS